MAAGAAQEQRRTTFKGRRGSSTPSCVGCTPAAQRLCLQLVPPSCPTAFSASRVPGHTSAPPHSSLRLPVEPIPCLPSARLPAVVGDATTATTSIAKRGRNPVNLALSTLRHSHGHYAETQRRGSLTVRLLRFVITLRRASVQRRACGTPRESCVQSQPVASGTVLSPRFRRVQTRQAPAGRLTADARAAGLPPIRRKASR